MRKKYLSALLFGALLFASAGTFTSCKDYDDDIQNLQEQINTINTTLDELTSKINNLGAGVTDFKYENGKLIIVTDKDTNFEVTLPEADGIKELEIKNGILYADGVEVGTVASEGSAAVNVEVKDGVLYINGEAQKLNDEIGSKVVVVDNGNGTYTLSVDGTSYVLPKASASLTSLKFENETATNFVGITEANGISWNVAATDVADWKGKKGAVKRNQLLVGQISTVNVQVTPASFDLGSMELSLKDSKGNEAPVKVSAVKNNMLLLSRSANAGSWLVSIEMNDDVTADNIATMFEADPEKASGNILYALCVDGVPVSNYDIEIVTRDTPAAPTTTTGGWNHGGTFTGFTFVDEEGYKITRSMSAYGNGSVDQSVPASPVSAGELPVGETVLVPNFDNTKADHLYDSYITFEGTNISLAKSKGIVADGMKITAPATAAGTTITASVYFMDITGKTSKSFFTFTVEASTAESIAATPVDYKVMPSVISAGQEIKLADIEIKDLTSVFAKIDAAILEKTKDQNVQISVVEEKDQKGFFIKNKTTNGLFDASQYSLLKKDGEEWQANVDDLSELESIKFVMGSDNVIASDAKPGDYKLYFVVKDEDNENEIIRVKMDVKVSKPEFKELFSTRTDAWKDGQYVTRIIPTGTLLGSSDWKAGKGEASINLGQAFVKVASTNADPAQLAYAFQTIDNKYPVKGLEIAYNGDKLNAISGTAGAAILDKDVMYNDDKNALEVSTIENMVAFTSVLAGLQSGQVETGADVKKIQEEFTVSSDAYTTKVLAALEGIKPVYYVNKEEKLASGTYVIPLNADGSIKPLNFVGGDYTKGAENGFGFELAGDIISASYGGTNTADHEFNADGALLGYNVQADKSACNALKHVACEAIISEGSIVWNNSGATPHLYKVTLNPNKQGTVTFTFTDATGVEYNVDVEVKNENK